LAEIKIKVDVAGDGGASGGGGGKGGGKAGKAWEGLKQLIDDARAAYEHFDRALQFGKATVEVRKLEMAFNGLNANLKRLDGSMGGTESKLTVMRTALNAMTGDLRLTQAGFEVVAKAADNYADKIGKDSVEVTNAFVRAIKTGQIKALKELGIQIDEGRTKQETLNNILIRYQELANDPGPSNKQIENFEKLAKKIDDTKSGVELFVGDVIVRLFNGIEALVLSIGDAFSYTARKLGELNNAATTIIGNTFGGSLGGAIAGTTAAGGAAAAELGAMDPIDRARAATARIQAQILADTYAYDASRGMGGIALVAGDYGKEKPKGGRKSASSSSRSFNVGAWQDQQRAAGQRAVDARTVAGQGYLGTLGGFSGDPLAGIDAAGQSWDASRLASTTAANDFAARQRSGDSAAMLAQRQGLMGGLGEADVGQSVQQLEMMSDAMARLSDRSQLAGGAFGALTDGFAAAVDAAISGGDGIAKAFAKAAAASLKSTAIQASINALFETAKGFAAIAVGSPSAAGHFKAAATFAATAAAAGVGSAALGALAGGGGGASAGRGAAGGGFMSARPSNDNGGPVSITINYGGMLPPTKQQSQELGDIVGTAVRDAQRAGRRGSYSTVAYERG
jgi:hypothetical protein